MIVITTPLVILAAFFGALAGVQLLPLTRILADRFRKPAPVVVVAPDPETRHWVGVTFAENCTAVEAEAAFKQLQHSLSENQPVTGNIEWCYGSDTRQVFSRV